MNINGAECCVKESNLSQKRTGQTYKSRSIFVNIMFSRILRSQSYLRNLRITLLPNTLLVEIKFKGHNQLQLCLSWGHPESSLWVLYNVPLFGKRQLIAKLKDVKRIVTVLFECALNPVVCINVLSGLFRFSITH